MPGTWIPLDTGQAGANNGQDSVTAVDKITSGYFADGGGTLAGNEMVTGSIASSNQKYYVKLVESGSTKEEFSLTYGHIAGSGSLTGPSGNNTQKSKTEAIYKQFANLLLEETQITGGFRISASDIYIMVAERDRYKDRVNKKNWTITFGGWNDNATYSASASTGSVKLKLTDDSANVDGVATVAGPRYNIVSGTLGTVGVAAATKNYGWFYPDAGVFVFSAKQLSGSIPGTNAYRSASYGLDIHNPGGSSGIGDALHESARIGLAPSSSAAAEGYNHVKLFHSLLSGSIVLRDEEDQTSVSYFCRVRANEMNFSNNPSFVSGSENKIRHTDMHGNPQVYISGVGLFDHMGRLVATAKLSTPIKKNFSSEATIKVKLTY